MDSSNPWSGELRKLYDVGQTTGGRNPIQDRDYKQLLTQAGLSPDANPGSFATDQALKTAKQAQQFQVQANQPAIQSLTQHKTDLDSKYKDLLSSITASEQPALDSATLATNNELGRRGITGDSGIAQTQIAGAQRPIATQFGQLIANTGVQRENDLSGIAQQIASLQAGNAPGALSFASGISSQQQQADQFQQQLAQQIAAQRNQARFVPLGYGGVYDATTGSVIGSDRPTSIGAGGLYDPNTGRVIQGIKSVTNSLNAGNSGGASLPPLSSIFG